MHVAAKPSLCTCARPQTHRPGRGPNQLTGSHECDSRMPGGECSVRGAGGVALYRRGTRRGGASLVYLSLIHAMQTSINKKNVNLQGCQSGKRSEQACVDLQAAVCMYVRTYGQRETAECLPLPAGVQERQEHGRRLPCLAPPWVPRPPPHQPTAAAKPRRLACRQQLLKLNHPNSNHRYRAT